MSIPLAELIDQVMQSWKQAGIPLLPPLDADTIRKTMQGLGRQVSADVLQLYQAMRGFADYDLYDNCWSLWSLDQIIDWNKGHVDWSTAPERKLIGFADVMIDSFFFCFHYENEEISSVWIEDGEAVRFLTGSVAEFLALCLSDPGKLGLLGPNSTPLDSPFRKSG
jgi:hypothetical protein